MAMEELQEYLDSLSREFAAQPARLRNALGAIPTDAWHQPIEGDGWTPHQVLAHVLAAQQLALQPRLMRILEEEEPDLPDWDQDRWMKVSYSSAIPQERLFSELQAGVREILDRVQGLDLEDWNRTGRHPLRGSRTLLWWFEYLIAHNRDHIQDLSRTGS